MNKKEKHKLNDLVTCIMSYIQKVPTTKELLIEQINQSTFNTNITIMTNNEFAEWNKIKVIDLLNELDENKWNYVLRNLKQENKQKNKEIELQEQLLDKLLTLYPNADIDLIEFCMYYKNCYGIKIHINEKSYLFEFDGTLDELVKEIELLIEESETNLIECPFCHIKYSKYEWLKLGNCKCGTLLVFENYRPNNLEIIMKDINAIKVIATNEDETDWAVWFLDKYAQDKYKNLENYNSVDKFNQYIKEYKYKILYSTELEIEQASTEFIISKDLLFKIINEYCVAFCFWVINGKTYNLFYPKNIDYDCSGELQEYITDKYYRIKLYSSVLEWLEKEYTGQKDATYISGMGFNYPKYCDILDMDILQSNIYYFVKKQLGDKYEEVIDNKDDDILFNIIPYLHDKIYEYLGKLDPVQCWVDYNDIVLEIIEQNENKINDKKEQDIKLELLSKEIWNKYFPEIKNKGRFVVCPEFYEFINKLKSILPLLSDEECKSLYLYPIKKGFSHKAFDIYCSLF